MQKHTLSRLLIPKQPLDCILLVCIQGFFGKVSKVLGIRHELGDLLPFFCSAKTVFPGRGVSCISSNSLFLREYLFVSCGCLFPNSCVLASLCSLKQSHPKGFICTPTKWIGSRFSVFSGPSSSCKRFLDTYGFSLFARPTRHFGWRQKIARV